MCNDIPSSLVPDTIPGQDPTLCCGNQDARAFWERFLYDDEFAGTVEGPVSYSMGPMSLVWEEIDKNLAGFNTCLVGAFFDLDGTDDRLDSADTLYWLLLGYLGFASIGSTREHTYPAVRYVLRTRFEALRRVATAFATGGETAALRMVLQEDSRGSFALPHGVRSKVEMRLNELTSAPADPFEGHGNADARAFWDQMLLGEGPGPRYSPGPCGGQTQTRNWDHMEHSLVDFNTCLVGAFLNNDERWDLTNLAFLTDDPELAGRVLGLVKELEMAELPEEDEDGNLRFEGEILAIMQERYQLLRRIARNIHGKDAPGLAATLMGAIDDGVFPEWQDLTEVRELLVGILGGEDDPTPTAELEAEMDELVQTEEEASPAGCGGLPELAEVPPADGRMDPEWKAKWLAALRSGDYLQGEGALWKREGEGCGAQTSYCCLGVLSRLVVDSGAASETEAGMNPDPGDPYRSDQLTLTDEVQDITGLSSDGGVYYDEDGARHALWTENDSGVSFLTLADRIEKYL